jgi:hypothetical protein
MPVAVLADSVCRRSAGAGEASRGLIKVAVSAYHAGSTGSCASRTDAKDQIQDGANIRDDTPAHPPGEITSQAAPRSATKQGQTWASSGDHTKRPSLAAMSGPSNIGVDPAIN